MGHLSGWLLAVARKNYYCDESMDEKLLLTIREEDLFTEDESTENFINYNLEYPSWYKGKRDEAMRRCSSGCGTTWTLTRKR